MKPLAALRIVLAFVALWPVALLAQDIRLTSRDGTLSVEGTLLGYDGEFYRIETVYGPLTLDGEGVVCEGPGCPDLKAFIAEISISGTRHMADGLLPALLLAFATQRGFEVEREVATDTDSTFVMRDAERIRARIRLLGTSTREGFADLIAEAADIALVLREPRQAERDMAESSGSGNLAQGRRARVVALDGIVAVGAPGQAPARLTLEEMAELFSDVAPMWSDFDGPDLPMAVHLPAAESGVREAFQERILLPQGRDFTLSATVHKDLETLVDTVAEDPLSVGLTTLSAIGNAAPIAISGACGYDQVASVPALRTEDYPLTLPLMLYTPARRLPLLAREFLDFVEGPRADLVVRRLGLVDQAIVTSDFNAQGNRLAHAIDAAGQDVNLAALQTMVRTLSGRKRLSTTFRFEGGSTRLDVPSRENAARLARAIDTGAVSDADLLFVGFSDGEGQPDANVALSDRRANAVLRQVRANTFDIDGSRVRLKSVGLGEVLPVACDDTDWGRAANRRVEVWIKDR